MTSAVRFNAATKSFGSVTAVDRLTFEIPKGSITALLGPNGAGKTTTLDMLLGLTRPTSGSVQVCGVSPRQAVMSGKVSAVLQSGGLLRDLTVRETVELIGSMFPHPTSPEEALERAGMMGLAKRRVSKCSGGEQQRLRFALALLPNPELLVLDEPTAGMDVIARQEFWAAMRSEAESGTTVVFATHYLKEADAFAERILMMAGGQIVADGTTREIRTTTSTGKWVSATVPDPHRLARLFSGRTHVHDAQVLGPRIVVHTSDADAVVLELLTRHDGSDIEVALGTLDDAFTTLTAGAPRATDAQPRTGARR